MKQITSPISPRVHEQRKITTTAQMLLRPNKTTFGGQSITVHCNVRFRKAYHLIINFFCIKNKKQNIKKQISAKLYNTSCPKFQLPQCQLSMWLFLQNLFKNSESKQCKHGHWSVTGWKQQTISSLKTQLWHGRRLVTVFGL